MKNLFIACMLLFLLVSGTALAQAPQQSVPHQQTETEPTKMEKVGDILLMYLVLAVVFEAALTPIFSWRVFLARFEGKGFKIPITVIIAFLVFWKYDLDIFPKLLDIFGRTAAVSTGGQIITALLIAGGSDGIWRIFTKLGIRNPVEIKEKAVEAQKALAEKKQKSAA